MLRASGGNPPAIREFATTARVPLHVAGCGHWMSLDDFLTTRGVGMDAEPCATDQIRVVALAIIRRPRSGQLLVFEGHDPARDLTYH